MLLHLPVALVLAVGAAKAVCPSGAQTLEELGASGEGWTTACRVARDGRRLVAGVQAPPAGGPEVSVAVAVLSSTARPIRARFRLQGPEWERIRAIAKQAETWAVSIELDPSAPLTRLRLAVFASHGEDLFVGQEVLTFLRLDGNQLLPVWTGLGDRIDRRFDSCMLESRARFRFLPDGRIERRITTRRTFRNAGVDESTADSLRKQCTAAPAKTDIFKTEQEKTL